MIMDDDIVLRKSVLEWGYGVFLEHNTLLRRGNPRGGRIVGFTGRDFIRGPKGASWKWDYNFQPRETYSLVLSNAAWFKKEWLEIYWSDRKEMTDLRDFVDDGGLFLPPFSFSLPLESDLICYTMTSFQL